jgi:ABC-type microcin C transport system permease subunit YejB
MWSYILRRLFFGIPTLLGVTIIVFTLLETRLALWYRLMHLWRWCR